MLFNDKNIQSDIESLSSTIEQFKKLIDNQQTEIENKINESQLNISQIDYTIKNFDNTIKQYQDIVTDKCQKVKSTNKKEIDQLITSLDTVSGIIYNNQINNSKYINTLSSLIIENNQLNSKNIKDIQLYQQKHQSLIELNNKVFEQNIQLIKKHIQDITIKINKIKQGQKNQNQFNQLIQKSIHQIDLLQKNNSLQNDSNKKLLEANKNLIQTVNMFLLDQIKSIKIDLDRLNNNIVKQNDSLTNKQQVLTQKQNQSVSKQKDINDNLSKKINELIKDNQKNEILKLQKIVQNNNTDIEQDQIKIVDLYKKYEEVIKIVLQLKNNISILKEYQQKNKQTFSFNAVINKNNLIFDIIDNDGKKQIKINILETLSNISTGILFLQKENENDHQIISIKQKQNIKQEEIKQINSALLNQGQNIYYTILYKAKKDNEWLLYDNKMYKTYEEAEYNLPTQTLSKEWLEKNQIKIKKTFTI